MDPTKDLTCHFIEACEQCHFPVRKISIKEFISRAESGKESFVYFASDEQKLKIMNESSNIYYWLRFDALPRIYCLEGSYEPEDSNNRDFQPFYEGWMPGTSKEEIFSSVKWYRDNTGIDHCYVIKDSEYDPINIEELI